MATRPKRPRDINQLAKLIVDIAVGEVQPDPTPSKPTKGRAGGLKGGIARAESLSPEKRKAIAQKASVARWKRPEKS